MLMRSDAQAWIEGLKEFWHESHWRWRASSPWRARRQRRSWCIQP